MLVMMLCYKLCISFYTSKSNNIGLTLLSARKTSFLENCVSLISKTPMTEIIKYVAIFKVNSTKHFFYEATHFGIMNKENNYTIIKEY